MLEQCKDFMGIYFKIFLGIHKRMVSKHHVSVSLSCSALIYAVAHTLHIYFAPSFFYVCEISFLFSCVTLPVMYL